MRTLKNRIIQKMKEEKQKTKKFVWSLEELKDALNLDARTKKTTMKEIKPILKMLEKENRITIIPCTITYGPVGSKHVYSTEIKFWG